MTEAVPNFEGLLREALAPVDPPADLVARLEGTLTSITEMAADELEAWELGAMRDPRNWARPAAALLAGGVAGTALVLLRARRRAQAHASSTTGGRVRVADISRAAEQTVREAEQTIRDLGHETRKLLGGR